MPSLPAALAVLLGLDAPRAAGGRAGGAPLPSSRAYAMFDGLFQQALLGHLSGVAGASDELRAGARQLLSFTVS